MSPEEFRTERARRSSRQAQALIERFVQQIGEQGLTEEQIEVLRRALPPRRTP